MTRALAVAVAANIVFTSAYLIWAFGEPDSGAVLPLACAAWVAQIATFALLYRDHRRERRERRER